MSLNIRLKHSATKDKKPLVADLKPGELALNINSASPAGYALDDANVVQQMFGKATETQEGQAEIATQAEVKAGTDTTRIVTPATAKATFVDLAGDTMTGGLTVPSLNGGQLAGFRNVLINGAVTINQRNVTYATAAVGKYWADRWKKTAGGMTQIVEEGSYRPSAQYTLSGTGVTTQQITSPATGNWTIPDVPSTATRIQLEEGPVATPFELRPVGLERSLCQRYYSITDGEYEFDGIFGPGTPASFGATWYFPVEMRANPTCSMLFKTEIHAQNPSLNTKSLSGCKVTWEWTNTAAVINRSFGAIISAAAEL